MANETPSIGQELASLPLGEMIYSIARAIADGQFQLDRASVRAAEFLSGQIVLRDETTGRLIDKHGQETSEPDFLDTRVYFGYSYDARGKCQANRLSMMELGFIPTFYQFVDTMIEIKVAIHLQKQGMSTLGQTVSSTTSSDAAALTASGRLENGIRTVINTTPVDARYTSSYNYRAEMASRFSTKLVPVPPPAILEERIRVLMEQQLTDTRRKEPTTEDEHDANKRTRSFTLPQGKVFSGSGDVVECGEINLQDRSFTVELWAQRTSSGRFMVALYQGKNEKNQALYVGFRASDVFIFDFNWNELDTQKAYPDTGEWHHWACVYDREQGTRVIYRDGDEVASDKPAASYAGSGELVIGAQYDAADRYLNKFDGQLAEIRIWSVARTQEQIRGANSLYLTGQEPGLIVYKTF